MDGGRSSRRVVAAVDGWQKQWTVAEAVDGWRKLDDGGRMADGGVMAEDRCATYGRKGWRIEMFVAREAVEVLPKKWPKELPEKSPKEPSAK